MKSSIQERLWKPHTNAEGEGREKQENRSIGGKRRRESKCAKSVDESGIKWESENLKGEEIRIGVRYQNGKAARDVNQAVLLMSSLPIMVCNNIVFPQVCRTWWSLLWLLWLSRLQLLLLLLFTHLPKQCTWFD